MKTKNKKYRIVDAEERLPTKLDEYYTSNGIIVFNPKNGKFWDHTDTYELLPHYWLEEVPDYEEEMKEMLEEVLNESYEYNYVSSDLYVEIEELLTKLKTES